jgi:hypothetical protein
MRFFVISTFALALTAATAVAQTPPAQAPQQPAAAQPAAPAAPKLSFKAPVGMLFVQIKPDQTAVFEEMMGKIINGTASATDADAKAQAGAWKYYKATEPGPGGTVMYIVVVDPAKPNTEYQFFEVIQKTLSDEAKRDPATNEMYKKYNAAIAGMSLMNLTPGGK